MKTLDEQMSVYAAYHRNRWNRLTHFFGVPLIIFAILVPMAWVRVPLGNSEITGAMMFVGVVLAYYFMLDALLAGVMVAAVAPLLFAADRVARMPLATGLAIAGAAFVFGWVLQLVGHALEGRRPALVDNFFQIFVAPIFLLAELFFAVGLKRDVLAKIEARLRAGTASRA